MTSFRNLNLDLMSGVQAAWNFEGDLTDSVGSLDLISSGGSNGYQTIDGLRGVFLPLGVSLERASSDVVLQITGDLTVHILVYNMTSNPAGDQILFRNAGSLGSELEADNELYTLRVDQTTSELNYKAEQSSGTDLDYNFEVGFPYGSWHLITLVRTSNQPTLYVDGEVSGANISSLTAPSGGTNSILRDIGLNWSGVVGGLAISNQSSTDVEVRQQWTWISNGGGGDGIRMWNLDPTLTPQVRAMWHFDGDITDSGPFGLDLSTSGGLTHALRFATIQGLQGVWLERVSTAKMFLTERKEPIALYGSMTIHVLFYGVRESQLLNSYFVLHVGPGSTFEDNILYQFQASNNDASGSLEMEYARDTGTRSRADHTFQVSQVVGGWHLYTLVRDEGGDVTLYIDGESAGVSSSGLGKPTNGTGLDNKLFIGGNSLYGFLGGLMIAEHESTASDVRDQWQSVMGRFRAQGETSSFIMRAYNTNLSEYVLWESKSNPDLTGSNSPYPPGDLEDIQTLKIVPGVV